MSNRMEPEESHTHTYNSDLLNAILSLQYETQHFGFHPRTFLDIVYNIFFENTTTSLAQMKDYLIQEFKDVIPPNLIKAQTDIFLQEIVKNLDKSIDKLEVFSNNNVFSIDKNVIFSEDEVHVKSPCTKEDDEKLDLEIKELKQKILEEKAKHFLIKKKVVEQKEVKEQLLHLQKELKSLLSIAHQKSVTPENIDSLYSDLNELHDLSLIPF